MDFTGNGLLAVSATICAITIAILAIFSCYKRETAENRKGEVLAHANQHEDFGKARIGNLNLNSFITNLNCSIGN